MRGGIGLLTHQSTHHVETNERHDDHVKLFVGYD